MSETLTRKTLRDVRAIVSIGDDEIYHGYVGRGMWGESCFGIIGDLSLFAHFMAALGAVLAEEEDGDPYRAMELADAARSDSMGTDTIYYFPGWNIEEDE